MNASNYKSVLYLCIAFCRYIEALIFFYGRTYIYKICSFVGVPVPEYRWTKDGKPLVWQTNPRLSLDPESGSLLIVEPEFKDNGWYQCIAYNEMGVAVADPVRIHNATRYAGKAIKEQLSL